MSCPSLFNAISEPAMILDLENCILEVNEKTIAVTGLSANELIGRRCHEVFHGQSSPPSECPYKTMLALHIPQSCPIVVQRLNETHMVSVSPIYNAAGKIEKVLHIARDITKQRQEEDMLKKSEEKYRFMVENAADLHYRTDIDGKITFISTSVKKLSGYSVSEALNHNIYDAFADPTEQKKFINSIKKKGVIRNFTAQLKRKNGSLWWGSSNNHCYRNQDGRVVGIEGIARDITQQKLTEIALQEMNEKLDFLASHDPMTGIYNRRKFFKLASSKFIKDSTDLYAAMMDIDKFKKINDTYGHPIGDLVIKAVTGTISEHLEKESIFGRLGGEEFAIICRYPAQKDAVKHLDLIREKVKQLEIRTERGDLIRCTIISIGLVKTDETTRNLDDLLHRADELLYKAKGSGRNKTIFRI